MAKSLQISVVKALAHVLTTEQLVNALAAMERKEAVIKLNIAEPSREPVTNEQVETLMEKDIRQLSSFKDKAGNALFPEISGRIEGRFYYLTIGKNQKRREAVTPSVIRKDDGKFYNL